MTDNELNHIKGLAETAIANANNAENKTASTEREVVQIEDAMMETYEEQTNINADVEDALCEIYELLLESEE